MHRISLHAAQDHILGLTKFRTPIVAVEELIWNALDADAMNVSVSLTLNQLFGLDKITVADDGEGLPAAKCDASFGSIGGSPKLKIDRTPRGRKPHGKSGRGRLKAFGLGRIVRWNSRYRDNGQVKEYSITGHKSRIDSFEITDPVVSKGDHTGVTVEVSAIDGLYSSLVDAESAAVELAQRLALYLNQYPGIKITYNGCIVDSKAGQNLSTDYEIDVRVSADDVGHGTLTIIEWDRPTNRALYLCDRQGFARDECAPGIQAKGWDFTAYFKSELVEKLDEDNVLNLNELHPTITAILDASKDALRTHFRKRASLRSADLVRQWKEEEVYPYKYVSADPVETAEREVFDVVALNVSEYLPSFENTERSNKRLTFRLIKQSLESNPTALQSILREVLALPADKQEEFAKLLEKTKLSAIINAAKTVVDRLDFLASLYELLFGEFQATLNEPRQLHPILSNELWMFGEQYQRGIDEESLKKTLERHIEILGRKQLVTDVSTVKDFDGRDRYLDLMLYQQYPAQEEGKFEHLVIELKRPSIKLGKKEINQIEEYAYVVGDDQRFDKENTQWTFVLIGNELNDFAKNRCTSPDRRPGHIQLGRVNIHVRTWSGALAEAKWRYEFFRKKLEYQARTDDALGFLRDRYAKYFPETANTKEEIRIKPAAKATRGKAAASKAKTSKKSAKRPK
jgi:hypothetical protein